MGPKTILVGQLGPWPQRDLVNRQDEPIEVREVGRIRPSSGGTGGHVGGPLKTKRAPARGRRPGRLGKASLPWGK
jgi:hypothetical protein